MSISQESSLIDGDTANKALAKITVGDMITYFHESMPYQRRVLEKGNFNLILEGLSSSINISIAQTEIYQQEFKLMPPMSLPGADPVAPRPRGRPRKADAQGTGPVAPTEVPQPVQAQQLPTSLPDAAYGAGATPDMAWQPPQNANALAEIRNEYSTGNNYASINNSEWINEQLSGIIKSFTDGLVGVVSGILDRQEDDKESQQPIPVKRQTCADCINCDVENGKCFKFNIFPPIFIVLEPTKCADFVNMEDEIPF